MKIMLNSYGNLTVDELITLMDEIVKRHKKKNKK